MGFLDWLIDRSVRHRLFVLAGTLVFIGLGVWSFRAMTFDAFPDLTNVQVQVLTASPGMASEEVEMLVTLPIERALSGVPRMTEMRSLSRTGISAITVVFDDDMNIWLARQLVKERLDQALGDIPDSAGRPEMAPPSTGLGEIYQFTLSSDRHRPFALYRVFERDVAPRLREVDGVVDVNAWGGGSPQLDVVVDPFRLAALGLPFGAVDERLREALGLVSGGATIEGREQRLVRAVSNPTGPDDLGAILLHRSASGSVRLRDVADIREGGALTVGLGSADSEGEAIFVMVQLLAGADALRVVGEVREKVEEVRAMLPDGVELVPVYDREKLVGNTLRTVALSLVEGGALVIVVLFLLLGDLRAGLLVASVIPMSMLGAFTGMNALGFSGNLMSLGAIDFGLIVDGTIVVTESIVALQLAGALHGERGTRAGPLSSRLGPAVVERAQHVAKPVLFAVGILLLVYTPILLMWGTEGKLFRPMAVTVLLALATALFLSFTYVPALASLIIKPRGEHQTWLIRAFRRLYEPALRFAVRSPAPVWIAAIILVAGAVVVMLRLGVEFVPRLEEGDIVVQTTRLPSLTPEQALREASRVERVLGSFPEVERVASRTGAPAVATDPMGLEEADILVQLAPRDRWQTAPTTEGLVSALAERLGEEAPGAEFNFTQPIEMRFNELLQGITADVGVKVYGPDLDILVGLAQQVAAALEEIPGAADVTPPLVEGVPGLDVVIDADRIASFGVSASAVLDAVAKVQRGTEVGAVVRGQFQDPVVVKLALPDGVPLRDLPIVLPDGDAVPLGVVADVRDVETPAKIQREAGSRRVVVTANVRGRDLGGFVEDAHDRVSAIDLPDGYWVRWSGQYEQLRAAAFRTAIMIPVVLFLILGVLYIAFDAWRPALLIFLNVPVAASGGFLILWLRDMPISMSAVVGFIALFGVAVMNGIVLLSRTRELHKTEDAVTAALDSALERFRPVLMTAFVAGIGFLPMAIATGVGAEVQRPLATVVIGGLVTSTLLTLLVLPSAYSRFCRRADTA